jgi:Big-like domain-containing protein/PKD domain-containing protein
MKRTAKLAALAVIVAAVSVACDKVPLLAPSGSVIALSANATTIPSGGSVGLTAFVTESSGTPVQNGTTVRFTSTLGTVTPSEVQTTNGLAVATFTASSGSGVAEVRAISGGATGTGTGTGTTTGGTTTSTCSTNCVQITVGSAAVTAVSVQANPATVPASGGTVDIIATATGGGTNGNVPLASIPVSFSTTAGTLSATTALTDANGEARVQLTTSRKATVTAIVGSQSKTVDVTPNAAGSVTLSTSPTNPTVGQAVLLTVTPATDTSPTVFVDWGDGNSSSLGVVRSAQTVAHTYRSAGSYAITVVASQDGLSFQTSTAVSIAPPPSVTISPSPNTGTTTTNFVFTITPATANGVKDVTIDFGDGESQDLGSVTAASTVSHKYGAAGTYTVKATETDGSGSTTTAITVVTVS